MNRNAETVQLFITRNYPPQVGGLESYSFNLINEFEKRYPIKKITLSLKKIHLTWFIPYCFFKSIILIIFNNIKSIHLCDALLSPVGYLLKVITGIVVTTSVHGLDITYTNRLYQKLVPWCVSHLDMVICVSRATKAECIKRGIPTEKCIVIPNGTNVTCYKDQQYSLPGKKLIEKIIGCDLKECRILVTVGRLVERKGVAWFVESVMPFLSKEYKYLVVGDGPEYNKIYKKIIKNNLSNSVFLMGSVSDSLRNVIYTESDLLVMPNITIKNDVEGFGIVAIEAGSFGLPVVATNIQGISDAVIDGCTGYLISEMDVDEFINKIKNIDLKEEKIISVINEKFSWNAIFKKYKNAIESKLISL